MRPTLYHCEGTRSFRPLWAMEELGIAYDLKLLPFPPRLAAPDYLADNPLGTVPLLIDGETRMRESVMIGHYLATKLGSPLAVAADEPDYGRYLDTLAYGETTLTWPQGVALLYGRFLPEGERRPEVVERMTAHLSAVFADLEAMLGDEEFIAAGRFTMADVAIGYAIKLYGFIGDRGQLSSRVRDYFERLAARPAFIRADSQGD